MRILTRYILGEILSHTLIGCAVFTFILFMRDLSHILEMVVRNSSTFTSVLEIFLFTLAKHIQSHDTDGGARRNSIGTEPSGG